jgi:hypothetical protein
MHGTCKTIIVVVMVVVVVCGVCVFVMDGWVEGRRLQIRSQYYAKLG